MKSWNKENKTIHVYDKYWAKCYTKVVRLIYRIGWLSLCLPSIHVSRAETCIQDVPTALWDPSCRQRLGFCDSGECDGDTAPTHGDTLLPECSPCYRELWSYARHSTVKTLTRRQGVYSFQTPVGPSGLSNRIASPENPSQLRVHLSPRDGWNESVPFPQSRNSPKKTYLIWTLSAERSRQAPSGDHILLRFLLRFLGNVSLSA